MKKPTKAARKSGLMPKTRTLLERYPMNRMIEESYVLSRLWAWLSQIQTSPELRIPVPRFLSYRDP